MAPRDLESRMLFDPARHEPLSDIAWDEAKARGAIEWIAHGTERAFSSTTYWPMHPKDGKEGSPPDHALYMGATGVIWALHYLEASGAVRLTRSYAPHAEPLLALVRSGLRGPEERAAYLVGETGVELLRHAFDPAPRTEEALRELIVANVDHPARELLLGSPGTMLAALFLHERTGTAGWADLYREGARMLRSHLLWSDEHQCHYWTQQFPGEEGTYLDAVHGFAAVASVLIRGRHLLAPGEWDEWERRIANTISRTASREGRLANWRVWLFSEPGHPQLVQFCHGAPGFVTCLAELPSHALDELLVAAGEMTWHAGPLAKGSNLCHGTGGNGYAFLKLFRRTRDAKWLDRARAFAMHAIRQAEADAAKYGRLRFSLWTGDPGLAIYLWDCVRERADFPTLDVFHA